MPAVDRRDLDRERLLLSDAVGSASELALGFFKKGVKSWHKSDKTPITEADLAVDRVLATRAVDAVYVLAHRGVPYGEVAEVLARLQGGARPPVYLGTAPEPAPVE